MFSQSVGHPEPRAVAERPILKSEAPQVTSTSLHQTLVTALVVAVAFAGCSGGGGETTEVFAPSPTESRVDEVADTTMAVVGWSGRWVEVDYTGAFPQGVSIEREGDHFVWTDDDGAFVAHEDGEFLTVDTGLGEASAFLRGDELILRSFGEEAVLRRETAEDIARQAAVDLPGACSITPVEFVEGWFGPEVRTEDGGSTCRFSAAFESLQVSVDGMSQDEWDLRMHGRCDLHQVEGFYDGNTCVDIGRTGMPLGFDGAYWADGMVITVEVTAPAVGMPFPIYDAIVVGIAQGLTPEASLSTGEGDAEAAVDYRQADLSGSDLSGQDLRGQDFFQADLRNATFDSATLTDAGLIGAVLWDASLVGANLDGAVLEGADLSGADFSGASLAGAKFHSTSGLGSAVWEGADLSGAEFRNTSLPQDGFFAGASLSGADFSGALLWDPGAVDLSGANLSDTKLRGDLIGVDLSGAVLTNSSIERALLLDSNLTGADLSGSDINRSSFLGADMTDASLRGVDFGLSNSDFHDVDLTGANFAGVVWAFYPEWGNTTCPDGTSSDVDDGDDFGCLANMAETLDYFIPSFEQALQRGDVEFLLGRLHPVVLERYDAASCRATIEAMVDPATNLRNGMRNTSFLDSWLWEADGERVRVSDVYEVWAPFSDQRHYGYVDAQLHWFTTCSEQGE